MMMRLETINYKYSSEIELDLFLKIAEAILETFKKFGTSFKIASDDIHNNIERLHKVSKLTIKQVIENEVNDKSYSNTQSNFNAILWLNRSIRFMTHILINLTKYAKSTEIIIEAYNNCLSKYHNFFVRQAFKSMIGLAPNKSEIIKSIGLVKQNAYKTICQELQKLTDNVLEHFRNYKLEDYCN